MIDSIRFLEYMKKKNFSLAIGVPCSYFNNLLFELERSSEILYVPATREDEAIGIASGYYFGGEKSFVIMQNSGLGNIGDALTSLAQLYGIPMLIFVSYRGLKEDEDMPEHSIMGEITENLLESMKIPFSVLEEEGWQDTLSRSIDKSIKKNQPVCLLIKKGVFD